MTTEEAAKAVVDAYDAEKPVGVLLDNMRVAVRNLRTALSASPWVSVKERMPTAADASVGWEQVLWLYDDDSASTERWDGEDERSGIATHWMPIPDTPITPTGGLRP